VVREAQVVLHQIEILDLAPETQSSLGCKTHWTLALPIAAVAVIPVAVVDGPSLNLIPVDDLRV
jgi:hypothetical protein